jgi:hypothetical protein
MDTFSRLLLMTLSSLPSNPLPSVTLSKEIKEVNPDDSLFAFNHYTSTVARMSGGGVLDYSAIHSIIVTYLLVISCKLFTFGATLRFIPILLDATVTMLFKVTRYTS